MNQKIYANWNLAATHYLTSVFASNALLIILNLVILKVIPQTPIIFYSIFILLSILTIWFGVFVSSKYINKKYLVTSKDKLSSFSAIYATAWSLIYSFILSPFLMTPISTPVIKLLRVFTIAVIEIPHDQFEYVNLMAKTVNFIIILCLFYILSKKYLKNSQQE